MSRLHWILSSTRISVADVDRRNSQRALASLFVLIAALLSASCGLLANNSSQNSGNQAQSLTLAGNFPSGVANQAYNSVLTVSGGSSPYQFAITSGSLPPGLKLNLATGTVSGTPTSTGSYSFEIGVTDAPLPHSGNQRFGISITPAGGGIHVSVSPAALSITSGQSKTFTAVVSGTDNTAVTWSASAGSVTAGGIFTAPNVSSVTTVYVTATSKTDSKAQGLSTVTVEPVNNQALAITTGGLPDGHTGNAYSAGLAANGGTPPYSWSATPGLPPGVVITSNNGELSGMPSSAGTYNFSVKVTDAKSQTAQKGFAITVSPGGNMDGPAELPRTSVSSAMSDTPAPGKIIPVAAGADLQTAINNAHCGDTLELQAGATYSGLFTLPAKGCDNGHWIIIRSNASDSALPPEGTRATPCFAGVSSLPGRPSFNCSNPQKSMARLQNPKAVNGPIILKNGASHYRLLGLEVTITSGMRGAPTLIGTEPNGLADHIIVDRLWLHGTAQDETQVGVSLNGINYAAVVDSYLNDFHCIAGTGTCTDAHAVAGGLGDHVDGPFKIENNFLEASGEAVLFGGGAATVTPTDMEFRRNHFFKPWQWMPGSQGFVGGTDGHPFVVKNHLELKNASRVLVEANLMENNWGGFSQNGFAIVLSPKNQHTQNNGDVCPLCQVTDITVRYNHVMHAGGGMQLITSISGNGGNGGWALAGARWSIHDVVFEDINKNYTGGGTLFELANGWPKNPLNTLVINHITGFPDPDSHLMVIGNQMTNPQMSGLTFTNNLVTTGRYPVWATGGGNTNCAYANVPVSTIANCFTTYTFANNGLIGTPQPFPPSSWPAGNLFSNDMRNAGMNNNFGLQANSPYHNKGTDGRDLGADIAGLDAALVGIE